MFKSTIKGCLISCAGLLILGTFAPKIFAQKGYVQEFSNPSSTIATKRNEKIHGNPYFNENWEKGRVWLSNGKKTPEMKLKYKPFTNELLFKKNGKLLAVEPKTMKGFVLIHDHRRFLFKNGYNAPDFDIKSNNLLQVIYEGKVKLLKKYKVKFHRGQNPDPYSGVINSYFRHYDDYFLVNSEGKFHKVKLKRNDILEALSSHQNELKTYAKSKDLNFDHPQDLKKILQEYDKMIAKAQ